MQRVINFSAGPSTIPLEVLKKAQDEFLSYKGLGFSIMEISHRSEIFENVLNSAKKKVKEIYNFSDEFEILFLQGGGSLQFAQVPLNLYQGNFAEYIDTGVWTQRAIKEAQIQNVNYNVIFEGAKFEYSYIDENLKISDNADYVYLCLNNTIYGTQYKKIPSSKSPLVVDASSELFSRPLDFSDVGILFGGIQKNGGPSGITLVVIRKDLLDRAGENVPTLLKYKNQVKMNSMCNTPNTFGIYMLDLMLEHILNLGGLEKINEKNIKKARLLYEILDENSDFYIPHAKKESRSLMNVSFKTIKGNEIDMEFVKEAEKNKMIGLKGHKHLGGLRASIYNAISYEDVEKLCDFMIEFAKKHR